MKVFAVLALLLLAVAEAQHNAHHSLGGSRFMPNVLYVYDAEFNVTSGVLGLSAQVSKAAIAAKVSIYAKNETLHILKIENVYTSGALKGVENEDVLLKMVRNSDLENRLTDSTLFTLQEGKVTSYTLSSRDNLESKKIRKSILRSLEMFIPDSEIKKTEVDPELAIPITYNTSKSTGYKKHTTHYMISVSPYAEFPFDHEVYNITRSDDFEAEVYPAYRLRSNFRKQGCPEVCRKDWKSNKYGAGCPVGFEPHNSPIKASFNHEHHLSWTTDTMNPEIIRTTEVHNAQMYDQDMEVLIKFQMRRKSYSKQGRIVEPPNQRSYSDLEDFKAEINEDEIDALCHHTTSAKAVKAAKELLEDISLIVEQADLSDKKSRLVGEKIVLLKKALQRLSVKDLEEIASSNTILKKSEIKRERSAAKKITRQIWLDMLPLIGTQESVTFIVDYVKNLKDNLLVWEAKEILEALPQNVAKPSKRNIEELMSLVTDKAFVGIMKNYHMLHSAVYMGIGRMVGHMCGNIVVIRSEHVKSPSWFDNYLLAFKNVQQVSSGDQYGPIQCPRELALGMVKTIEAELKATESKQEIAIYLETLAHIAMPEVLPILARYVYGVAESLERHTPRFVDFVKSMSILSLHNIAGKHPEEVLELVLPVFFNRSESPKVRNAAFGVLIRCHPSLEILERVAHKSWDEPSKDVASFVASTFETFGNTSLPCMQLTSHRIKKVMPHLMKQGFGIQHAKNLQWSYFDDLRSLGMEGRYSFTPNNESFVPSSIYKAWSYSTDNLKDIIIQMSLNVEGLTQRKIFDFIEQNILGIDAADTIPDDLFSKTELAERIPDEMRFTLYNRIFYKHSFYYFDKEFFMSQISPCFEYLSSYMQRTKFDISGQLVKVILPSSFHTLAIAKTLPYPIEFEMEQPLVLSLKVKSLKRDVRLNDFHLFLRPSVYWSQLYTNQLKYIGDCKEVGTYFENKFAASVSFETKLHVQLEPSEHSLEFDASYKLPELKKKVFSHFSECGTYAGKKNLKALPSFDEREPIKTIPAPFKFEEKVDIIGIPPLKVEIHTEDVHILRHRLPRTPTEAFDFFIKKVLNAGWRYKSYNITIEEDRDLWPANSEVTFKVAHSRKHVSVSKSGGKSSWGWNSEPSDDDDCSCEDEDWDKDLNPGDIDKIKDPKDFIDQGKDGRIKLIHLPHIEHLFQMRVETKPVHSAAYVRASYNHTYEGRFHVSHIDAAIIPKRESRPYVVTFDTLIAYLFKDNEFKYEISSKPLISVVSALRIHRDNETKPWEKVHVVTKGLFSRKDLRETLESELAEKMSSETFLPETHEQCLKDVQDGHPLSNDCLKALRESTIFNNLNVTILWEKNIPEILKKISRRTELYWNHYFFSYLNISDEMNDKDKISINLQYINKLTDEPKADMTIRKPTGTLYFKRAPTYGIQPQSSIFGFLESTTMSLTNNTYPATCVMMKKYVQTYDLKSYRFWADKCEYVLTSHCTKDKNFAVIAKAINKQEGTKEIHAYIGKNILILTPESHGDYKIKFNGAEYSTTEPTVFKGETDIIYVFREKTFLSFTHFTYNLRVIAKKAGLNILYDGVNIKVQIDPKYKGEMCGLCSEFDGDELREFRGLDRCLYNHYLDFANSAIFDKDSCSIPKREYGQKICDSIHM